MTSFELPKPEVPQETRQDEVTVKNDYLPPAATNQVISTIPPYNDYLPPAATNQVVSTVKPDNDYLPPAATNQVSTIQPYDEDKGYDYPKPTIPFDFPKQPGESRVCQN